MAAYHHQMHSVRSISQSFQDQAGPTIRRQVTLAIINNLLTNHQKGPNIGITHAYV